MLENKPEKSHLNDIKKLDSMTFIEIPQIEIAESLEYGRWLVEEVERKWMTEFNHGNLHWHPDFHFNTEYGIYGFFDKTYVPYCKLYRYDGRMPMLLNDGSVAFRGFLIRDHYTESNVLKVQLITENLERFLKQENISYRRENYRRSR